MSDKARSIYDKIINSKVASKEELGTPEMFTKYVSSPENASKIYQKLLSRGLSEAELGTQDMFVSAIVPKSSVSAKAPTAQSPTATTTGIKAQEQRSLNDVSTKKQGGEKGDLWIQDLGDKLNEGSANIFGGVLGWLGEGEDLINKGISKAATAGLSSIPVGGWLKSLYFKGAETGTKVFKKTLMDNVTNLYKRHGLFLEPVGEGVELLKWIQG